MLCMHVHLPSYLQSIATPFLEKRRNSKFDLFPRSLEVDTRDIVVPVAIVQDLNFFRDVVISYRLCVSRLSAMSIAIFHPTWQHD